MITVDQYQRLQQERDEAVRKAERLAGQLESVLARIKAEYGYKTLDEAAKLLAKKEAERDRLGKEAEKELAKFHKEWDGRIDAIVNPSQG